nr:hypothetical protein [Sphingomonas sp. CDS-1]
MEKTRTDNEKLDWLAAPREGFGRIRPEYEYRFKGEAQADYSVTETWWFTVSDAASGLTANFYIAMKPNLGICSAGSWMFRGHRHEQMLADHLNFQVVLPEPLFDGDRIAVPQVGLEYRIVKPFEEIHVRYDPPGFDVSADLVVTHLFDPVIRANERHFEQATWTKGTIRIGDESFAVDGPSFRDRSWGEARREDALVHPPIAWLYGVTGNGTGAFNLSGIDDPAQAVWAGGYDMAGRRSLFDGWIMTEGELRRVVSMSKRTVRDPRHQRPLFVEVDFEDEKGIAHRLRGAQPTSYNIHFWPNHNSFHALTEWELDGVPGIGGCQDYIWPEFAKRYWTA